MNRVEKLTPGWECDKTNGGMDFCIRATYHKCNIRIDGLSRKQVEQVDALLRYVGHGAVRSTQREVREVLGIIQDET